MSEAAAPIYRPGDVVYGADPFKGAAAARPWVIVSNHEGRPFHGDQYVALALTTRTWMDGLVRLDDSDWQRGGTSERSHVVPWGVQSIGREDVEYWQGRLDAEVRNAAVGTLVDELESSV